MRALVLAALLLLAQACRAAEPAHLSLVGDIDSDAADAAVGVVAGLKDVPYLAVTIDSPGGSVFDGLTIIRALRASPVPVVCTVQNLAASMAAIILEAGCNKRIAYEHSIIMFHGVSSTASGPVKEGESEDTTSRMRAINRSMAALVAARLGISTQEYTAKAIDREWWIVGADAQRANAIDVVLPEPKR